jgi:hypothetical protein
MTEDAMTAETQPTGPHTLTLHKTTHETPQGAEVTYHASCSCGWGGDEYGTDLARLYSFWSSDPDLCEAAAVEAGDAHLADQG